MRTEEKICQNCKQSFTIEPEDFQFYEKIKVPPPTFCPDCRTQRRMAVRNERILYRDICDLCKKNILSMYSPDKPFTVYCPRCWYGDGWDPISYGMDYDWNTPFFIQFRKLIERVPRIALFTVRAIDVDYGNFVVDSRNVYLAFSIVKSENIYYSRALDKSRECLDSFNAKELEQCYEIVDGARNYQCRFIFKSRDCINSAFLFDCVNCQNCFMSSNLRNRQYVLRNKQYSKEEYERLIKEIHIGKESELAKLKQEFADLQKQSLHRFASLTKAYNCTGDNIEDSKDVRYSFAVYGAEHVKYSGRVITGAKDVYDCTGAASEFLYELVASGFGSFNARFSNYLEASRDITYSDWCHNSSNFFGCSGLRKKQYCILNKQYTKEEYESLVPRIVEHMQSTPFVDKKGRIYRFGEFFPIEFSPWAYNEILAEEFFPLTKEQALAQGYAWRDPDPYPHKPTIIAGDLPDDIKDAQDSVLNEIIGCPSCGRAYRIIKPELDFLRKQTLALPRKCPDCRHRDRFLMRNPIKLWHRQCVCDYVVRQNTVKHSHHPKGRCPNEFETSYSPERTEVVYCESCYNSEIV